MRLILIGWKIEVKEAVFKDHHLDWDDENHSITCESINLYELL